MFDFVLLQQSLRYNYNTVEILNMNRVNLILSLMSRAGFRIKLKNNDIVLNKRIYSGFNEFQIFLKYKKICRRQLIIYVNCL